MNINPDIFKAYDIRGKFPVELNEDIAERIGNAAAQFLSKLLHKKSITFYIGSDVRVSSPKLKNALIRGIILQGSNVIDVGVGTTPYFYYLMHAHNPEAGVMVTASHNPPEYNGFKIRRQGGRAVAEGTGIEKIKKLVLDEKVYKATVMGKILPAKNYINEYVRFLAKGFKLNPINTVIDTSGGSVGLVLPILLTRYPKVNYKPLFFEPDGTFGTHLPNPLDPRSQQFIKKELEKGGFQFGVIFDGDGDRIVFFDERGNAVRPEFIAALFAEEELKKNPGSTFVFPVNASKGVQEYIKEHGGKIKLSRIGYVFIQEAMIRNKAVTGFELSGHFYFRKFFFDDSALMAWLKFTEILSKAKKPLSELVKPFERYVNSGEVNFPVENKQAVLNTVRKNYRKAKFSLLDGITAEFPDWWFNIRPSNTEPILRLVLEAKNQALFDEKLKEMRGLIK